MAKRNITLHDKHKSTTALYPKIDAKSLTQEAINEITRITEVVVEEQVVPNPTPTGTPETLEYITINGVEYKVEGGTLVIANPTLAGTEADLTGIQIGDVKYKIGGGSNQLYLYQFHWGHPSTDSYSGEYGLVTLFYKEWLTAIQAKTLLRTFLANNASIYASGTKYNKLNNKIEIIKRMYLVNDTFTYETIDTQNTVVGQSYLTYPLNDNDLYVNVIRMF